APAVEVEPKAHSAPAGADVQRIIDPAPPRGEVGVLQLGVHLPAPRAPVAQVPAAQVPAHVERRRELGSGLALQGEAVPEQAVAQEEVQLPHLEYRRAPQLVLPADARVADHDLALRQHPLRDAGVSLLCRVQLDPRDLEVARLVAAYLELRPL